MTELIITPKVVDKTARFKGAIAAGEHVAVTIKGGAEWIGTDNGANLTLRVLDLVTGRTLAVFPYWTEDNQEDWPEDVTSADAWETSGDDNADLSCTLNLNTLRMVAAARHMLRVPVLFVLGDTDDPRTLYFRDRYEVEYWPERIGDTTPYDLDNWPKKIDEWTELVADWTTRLDGLALDAERTPASGGDPGFVTITLNDGTLDEPKTVTVYDGEVSQEQLEDGLDEKADKVANATNGNFAALDANGNLKDSGHKHADYASAVDFGAHANDDDIHVTFAKQSAWTAKYAKPSGGIPKTDLASGVQASLSLADSALQSHQDISGKVDSSDLFSDGKIKSSLLPSYVDDVLEYASTSAFPATGETSKIYVAKDTNKVYRWSGSGYVEISPAPDLSAYAKTADLATVATSGSYNDLSNKPTIPTVDAALSTPGAAADAKAVGDALRGGFTEWVCDEISDGWTSVSCEWDTVEELGTGWFATLGNGSITISVFLGGNADSVNLEKEAQGSNPGVKLSRHLVTPTKTSQLTNDGAPNGSGTPYATTAQVAAKQDALSAAQLANIAAVPNKANITDLPYRLVEPGEWEFSGVPTRWEITDIFYELGDWSITYLVDGAETDSLSTQGSEDAMSLTFVYSPEVHITATRPSLPGHLLDRAGNRVVVSGDTTLTLPAANPGYLRDFLVRLEISGSTVPTITFAAPTGETITYETDGDEFPVPDEAGGWLYSFTETAAGVFAVALKKVNEVAAPQAQGGS